MFDFSGGDRVIRDYQGNVRTLRHLGESLRAALTDPLTPVNVQPVGLTGFGDPLFSDEFSGSELNTSKWESHYPDTEFWNATVPGGNLSNTDEPQGYDPSGITFDADGLMLTLREEETVTGLAYTSGMITSYPSFNPLYGAFEARMKLSDTEDAWPAFWMDRTDMVWPPEIDWIENDGKASFNLQTYHTFHYPADPGGNTSTVHNYDQDVGSQWHTFGGVWEPDRIRWYVDGVMVKDLATEAADSPMYLICNLAGKKDSTPQVPAIVHVDYIRAWSLPL
jgi:beta-glucanase (GH16 family)